MSFAKPQNSNNSQPIQVTKVTDIKILVTVDSLEDLESTFKIKDIKKALNQVDDHENVSFEIVCKGEPISNGKNTTLSYRVNGNTENAKGFLKSIKTIRIAAIKYYKNKQ
jgi:hypothetical protein